MSLSMAADDWSVRFESGGSIGAIVGFASFTFCFRSKRAHCVVTYRISGSFAGSATVGLNGNDIFCALNPSQPFSANDLHGSPARVTFQVAVAGMGEAVMFISGGPDSGYFKNSMVADLAAGLGAGGATMRGTWALVDAYVEDGNVALPQPDEPDSYSVDDYDSGEWA